jgi:hypothetical protein
MLEPQLGRARGELQEPEPSLFRQNVVATDVPYHLKH